MGCCGCTLQTSAIVAAVFGIIESVAGLLGGIIYSETIKPYRLYYGWRLIKNVMISGAVFNALWLVATIILIIGIIKQNPAMHRLWVGATSLIMVVDLAHTIALVVAIVNITGYTYPYSSYTTYNYTYYSTPIYLLVIIMTAVSRGSVWLWIINICLTIYTAHRANEIERGGPGQPGQTVFVYGQQPVQSYPIAGGHTVIVQHGGPATGMAPTNYGQPPAQYGQPPAQYGQPQPQYGQPPPQYGQPPQQYGQPPQQYGQPPTNPDQDLPSKY